MARIWLGWSYYFSDDINNAKNAFEGALKYSEMLKANGKYEASNTQMKKFASLYSNDDRAVAYNSNPNYLAIALLPGFTS